MACRRNTFEGQGEPGEQRQGSGRVSADLLGGSSAAVRAAGAQDPPKPAPACVLGSAGQLKSYIGQMQRGSGHGVRGCTAWSPRPRKPCAACSEFFSVRGSVSKAQQARKTRQRADHGGGCTHQWESPHDRFRVLQALLMLIKTGATPARSRPWWPPPAAPRCAGVCC